MTGGKALIIQHCAVFGRLETPVRKFTVEDVRPYAQSPISVSVVFVKPRERRAYSYTIKPDDSRYLTVEVNGEVVYDSRKDVPCDMEQWAVTRARSAANPAFKAIRS
jgi:hypothetical protein